MNSYYQIGLIMKERGDILEATMRDFMSSYDVSRLSSEIL